MTEPFLVFANAAHSAIMASAAWSAPKPPTPVPNAGNAMLSTSSSPARANEFLVAMAIFDRSVARSCPIAAAWMTYFAGSLPPPVTTASPTSTGPFETASLSISGPPARFNAPATPAPIQRWLFAAFTIASTLAWLMSPR